MWTCLWYFKPFSRPNWLSERGCSGMFLVPCLWGITILPCRDCFCSSCQKKGGVWQGKVYVVSDFLARLPERLIYRLCPIPSLKCSLNVILSIIRISLRWVLVVLCCPPEEIDHCDFSYKVVVCNYDRYVVCRLFI